MAFTVIVDALADNVFEGSEQFELTLAIDQAFQDRGVDLGNPSKAMVTIEETEGTYVCTYVCAYSTYTVITLFIILLSADVCHASK